jgi:hypothetical protein
MEANVMRQNLRVRVVKREQKARDERPAEAAKEERAEPSERELKTVMSGWVREHKQRADEYRRTFADLLRQAGFNPATAARRS